MMPRTIELTSALDHDIDEIVTGYLECALWSSTIDEKGETPADDVYDIWQIDAQSRDLVEADVRAFVTANLADCVAYCRAGRPADYLGHDLWLTLGHDLWLTRNGHGAGFWDRGLGALGERLTSAAKVYGSSDVYAIDDETYGIQ